MLLAGGALAAFVALTGVVLLVTGGEEEAPAAEPAPRECLRRWNADEQALSDGRHASTFHGYSRTQVAYVSAAGELLGAESSAAGDCAVIFASNGLDSEPQFAVRVLRDGTWTGLAATAPSARLAALQDGAFDGANAEVHEDGRLVATDGPAA